MVRHTSKLATRHAADGYTVCGPEPEFNVVGPSGNGVITRPVARRLSSPGYGAPPKTAKHRDKRGPSKLRKKRKNPPDAGVRSGEAKGRQVVSARESRSMARGRAVPRSVVQGVSRPASRPRKKGCSAGAMSVNSTHRDLASQARHEMVAPSHETALRYEVRRNSSTSTSGTMAHGKQVSAIRRFPPEDCLA